MGWRDVIGAMTRLLKTPLSALIDLFLHEDLMLNLLFYLRQKITQWDGVLNSVLTQLLSTLNVLNNSFLHKDLGLVSTLE